MANSQLKEVSLGNGPAIDEFLNTKELKDGQSIAGEYLGSFQSGKFNSTTHKIKLEADGRLIGLSGGGMLNKKLANVAPGTYVEVIYQGMSTIKSGDFKGSKSHNFKVLAAAPEVDAEPDADETL